MAKTPEKITVQVEDTKVLDEIKKLRVEISNFKGIIAMLFVVIFACILRIIWGG